MNAFETTHIFLNLSWIMVSNICFPVWSVIKFVLFFPSIPYPWASWLSSKTVCYTSVVSNKKLSREPLPVPARGVQDRSSWCEPVLHLSTVRSAAQKCLSVLLVAPWCKKQKGLGSFPYIDMSHKPWSDSTWQCSAHFGLYDCQLEVLETAEKTGKHKCTKL